jgi:di/tricarboxylate transporter
MASTIEVAARARRQAVVSKVVWGLLFMTMGVLFMLENLGKIDLGEQLRYPASNAVDGDPETRWSSAFSDPQWITVDLGSPVEITRVRLNWEAAYATQYAIEVSDDGSTWSTAKSVTKNASGIDDHQIAATGRYVRVLGTKRATSYGYSLFELEVFGPAGLVSQGRPATVSSREGLGSWARFWPLLMIGAGLPPLLAPKDGGDQVLGLFLTGFGVFLQLQRLALVKWTFAQTWPILLMAAGLLIVAQAIRQMASRAGGDQASSGGPQ